MAGHGGRGRKKKAHHEEEHENEERWLVSFADMMTLLMCLFMVLFSMSSVNTSKFEALQKSLQDAFSGRILTGGAAVLESGNNEKTEQEAPKPPLPALMPLESIAAEGEPRDGKAAKAAADREEEEFKRLKQLSEEELHFREMTVEGILAIQAGDNPRVVAEKLVAFVPPAQRENPDEAPEAAGAARAAA